MVKRLLSRLALLLVLATVVNVVVAWAIWGWGNKAVPRLSDTSGRAGRIGQRDLASWSRRANSQWPAEPDLAWDRHFFGSRFRTLIATVGGFDPANLSEEEFLERADERSFYTVKVATYGWPIRCLGLEEWSESHGLVPFSRQTSGLRIGTTILPARPVWGGFIVNTLLYAIFLALIAIVGYQARRVFRVMRSRCPNCAYQLVGDVSAGCSECGWNRNRHSAACKQPPP